MTSPPGLAAAPLDAAHAAASLDGRSGNLSVEPVAAYHGQLLLSLSAAIDDTATPERFQLWDPKTNARRAAWTGEPGAQDIVSGSDGGDWIATVRTGYSLPFPAWALIVRNLTTGEARVLATGDTSLASEPDLHPDVPTGFAPLPAIADGRVAWDEYLRSGETVSKRVQLYDFASGVTRTIAQIPDATKEDLRFPALGRDGVAVIRRSWQGAEETSSVQLTNLATGETTMLAGTTGAWSAALLNDGRLAWDDTAGQRFIVPLTGGEPTMYAQRVGWGTFSNGRDISWTPGADNAGYFDPSEGALRMVRLARGANSNVAGVFGPWFAWQEITPGGDSRFYVVPLPS